MYQTTRVRRAGAGAGAGAGEEDKDEDEAEAEARAGAGAAGPQEEAILRKKTVFQICSSIQQNLANITNQSEENIQQVRNTVVSVGKCTWRQGARREAGAVILSSSCHLICMLRGKTFCQAIEWVLGKPLKV